MSQHNVHSTDTFLQNIVSNLENKLQEIDTSYYVQTMKSEDLIQIVVKNDTESFPVIFEEWLMEELKEQEPTKLDKKIWNELQLVGLNINPQT